MGKPTKAKSKPTKPSRKSAAPQTSLAGVYTNVETLLREWMPPFKAGDFTVKGKESLQLVTPKPIAIPGAYGGKPLPHQFAAVILQKGYVGLYLMGVYSNPALKKKISPALLKTLKGKSCFHLKTADESMKEDIRMALGASAAIYRKRGWM